MFARVFMMRNDKNRDGKVEVAREEFVGNCGLPEDMSKPVFDEFDTDGDGELVVPEYLRVWGRWARSADGN